jgi:ATP-dependent Clp protease ATP-binding subunit ClpC
MFERFTNESRRAVVLAQEEARRFNHNYIGTEHLLAGLRREERGAAARALESAGITVDAVRGQIETIIGQGTQPPSGHIPFTPRAKKCLELSLRQALKLNHRHIDTGHLLLALISKDDCVAVQVLGGLGTDLGQLRAQVISEIVDNPEDRDDSPPLHLSHARLHDPLQDLLAEIDDRLSAIEVHLGITRPVPETEAEAESESEAEESSAGPENVVPPS